MPSVDRLCKHSTSEDRLLTSNQFPQSTMKYTSTFFVGMYVNVGEKSVSQTQDHNKFNKFSSLLKSNGLRTKIWPVNFFRLLRLLLWCFCDDTRLLRLRELPHVQKFAAISGRGSLQRGIRSDFFIYYCLVSWNKNLCLSSYTKTICQVRQKFFNWLHGNSQQISSHVEASSLGWQRGVRWAVP